MKVGARRGAGRDGCDEAVAALGKGFDEAGIVSFVGERVTEFVDGRVEAVLEIDKSVFWPKAFLELLASDDKAGVFQKNSEDLEGAILELQADARFAEFAGEQVGFVGAEADDRGKLGRGSQKISCW